jgi:hypothetical protein
MIEKISSRCMFCKEKPTPELAGAGVITAARRPACCSLHEGPRHLTAPGAQAWRNRSQVTSFDSSRLTLPAFHDPSQRRV